LKSPPADSSCSGAETEQDDRQQPSPAFLAGASLKCRSCHPEQFREWIGSVHAFATRAPASSDYRERDPGDREDPICRGCHGSLDRLLGKSFPPGHPIDLSHLAERTISCTTCHQITDEHARLGGSNLPEGQCIPRDADRSDLEVPFHKTKSMATVHLSETCGFCHQVTSPSGVPLERTYSQYLESLYPARSITCATCHMRPYTGPTVPGGPLRYKLHRHDTLGVDVAANAVPWAGSQRDRVLRLLRPSVVVAVLAPEAAEAGRDIQLEVELKNTGAGHNFPAGPAGERRMWLQVTARAEGSYDGNGIFFSSGAPGPDGEPESDPHLIELADRLLDRQGMETHRVEEAVRVEERSLKAMEMRRVAYRIPVGRDLLGSSIRIQVRLLFRAASLELLRARGLEDLAGSYPVLELFRGETGPIPVKRRDVPPDVVRVPEDVPGIALAVSQAVPGGTVLVAPGTYDIDQPIELPGRGITLRGSGGPDRTILTLSEIPADPERASVVLFRGGLSTESSGPGDHLRDRLSGFTIRGGRGTRMEGGRYGGAILCQGARGILENVVLLENRAEGGDGGGIFIQSSDMEILDSDFLRNRATGNGGGLASRSSTVRIDRCRFRGNSAGRGGAAALGADARLEDVEIRGNWADRGGGLSFQISAGDPGEAPAAILRSRVIGNLARIGGGLEITGPVPLEMDLTLIGGNIAEERGGALALWSEASPRLDRITMVENLARSGGAVFGDRESGAAVRNSIIWRNVSPSLKGSVDYSIVDDPRHGGGTNPPIIPIFEVLEGQWADCEDPPQEDCIPIEKPGGSSIWRRWIPGDYRILITSDAVDAGDPRHPPDPDGTRVDLGAFQRPQPERSFIRGDADGNGRVDFADAVFTAIYLARDRVFPCASAADYDDNGRVEPADVYWLFTRGFGPITIPPPPFPHCGLDPTPEDGPGCFESTPPCETKRFSLQDPRHEAKSRY